VAAAALIGSLLAALGLAGLLLAASRRAEVAGLAAFAFLAAALPLQLGAGPAAWQPAGAVVEAAALLGAGLCLRLCLRGGVFRFPPGREMKWWRVIARPFALLFVPIDILFGRTPLLFLLGGLALLFSALDLVRLFSRLQMRQLFKKSEQRRFSSMTAFVVAIFLIFLAFPDHLPYLGLGFITLGDLASKIVGIRFGRRVLLRGRTVEGSLAFAAGSFAAAWLLRLALKAVPLYAVLAGAVFATLAELFSGKLDDNFTVGIVSTGFLFSLRYFLGA
jgi:dolichol kinase